MDEIKKGEVLLKVENLCQYFGRTKAVDDVSFEIKKGEVFGLVGESGCGKTTTGRSIIKLYDITSGSIYYKGRRIAAGTMSYRNAIKAARKEMKSLAKGITPEIQEKLDAAKERLQALRSTLKTLAKSKNPEDKEKLNATKEQIDALQAEMKSLVNSNNPKAKEMLEAKREEIKELQLEIVKAKQDHKKAGIVTDIQMIFQDPIASLDGRLTVRETIAEGLIITGIRDPKVIDEMVFNILETVGLVREHATRYPHEFSGGQRQRIGIARAIIMNPELLIADEPISALDVSIQAQVINLLNELREKLGLTVLFIAHDLSVVKYFSDRIGVMYYGHMVELTTSDELFAHPMHPYTKSLLSAIPLPDPHLEKNRTRISYNPLAEHDYSVDQPTLREIYPGHFVRCNDAEERKYKEELGL